jgi:hypothetical protein
MDLPIPPRHAGQVFLLSPDGRDADWCDPSNIPARCADWTDVTEMGIAELDMAVGLRMAMNPRAEV